MKKVYRSKVFWKYLILYLLIFALALGGVFYVIKWILKVQMEEHYRSGQQDQLLYIQNKLQEELYSIQKSDRMLDKNMDLIWSRYKSDAYGWMVASHDIQNTVVGNTFLKDILYLDLKSGKFCNADYIISADKKNVCLQGKIDTVFIPYAQYQAEERKNYFLKYEIDQNDLLLYCPGQDSMNYIIYYSINIEELEKYLLQLKQYDIVEIGLLDEKGDILCASNNGILQGYLEEERQDANIKITKYPLISANASLVLVQDLTILDDSIRESLRNVYLMIFGLCMIGIILSYIFMRVTYLPIHKLAVHVDDESGRENNGNELLTLDRVYKNLIQDKKKLSEKLYRYKMMIEQSIFSTGNEMDTQALDMLFESPMQYSIFVVSFCFHSSVAEDEDSVIAFFKENAVCIQLTSHGDKNFFIMSLDGVHDLTSDYLENLFLDFCDKYDCSVIVSSLSGNPMDIPRLYEEVLRVEGYAENYVIVKAKDIVEAKLKNETPEYPYSILDDIRSCLVDMNLVSAKDQMEELFQILSEREYPVFYSRCVLLDTLNLVVEIAVQTKRLNFEKIADIYYECLYLCRSKTFDQEKENILSALLKLMNAIDKELAGTSLKKESVEKYLFSNMYSSELSISMLADEFHVAVPYMSSWFKKNFQMNYSDFIWKHREAKAIELMKNTDCSIEDIAAAVGYDIVQSFRRKFKEKNGCSPANYRMRILEGTDISNISFEIEKDTET